MRTIRAGRGRFWVRATVATGMALSAVLASRPTRAEALQARTPDLPDGASWTMLELEEPHALAPLPEDWESRTFWDLRPMARTGRTVRYVVSSADEAGLEARAAALGIQADRAVCAFDAESGLRIGCSLFRTTDTTAAGIAPLWSEPRETSDADRQESLDASRAEPHAQTRAQPRAQSLAKPPGRGRGVAADAIGNRLVVTDLEASRGLATGDAYRQLIARGRDIASSTEGQVVGEGIVLVPAGPFEALLVRERVIDAVGTRVRYRFLTTGGLEVARLEGANGSGSTNPEVALDSGALGLDAVSILIRGGAFADNGVKIGYTPFHKALAPGTLGFLQYAVQTNTALTALHPAWTNVMGMIGIDATNVPYQPDPGDPSTSTTLPEVWDFTGLTAANLSYRIFNTVRSDLAGNTCGNACSTRDVSAAPPDGTWQSYLKIDVFAPGGAFSTRNIFDINDNDTGANPSIDVPFVAQDENNVQNRTQLCFQQSVGGASRFLRFFRFTGATPATALMGVGDTWTSGAWTECDDAHGLKVTAASVCGSQCWPGCSSVDPRGRGRLGSGAGFRSTIIEDGWVKVPAGNYLPALLMRQDTDIQIGLDFLTGICNLGTQNNRAFDYFWLNASYGFVATVSSVAHDTMPGDDWTASGNLTDGAEFTWGPYPPYQTEAKACLAGTKVSWSLPADGSNLSSAPGVSAYGYVVSWGSQTDPEQLADWTGNPNHTPLPGTVGYLAAPVGSEPTSTVITSWAGGSINATVVTALRYTDPDVADVKTYKSAALYKVAENPARLSAATFRVGQAVAPFVTRLGSNLRLSWPTVAGAGSYKIRVFNLLTKAEIPCPAGLSCTPAAPPVTHTNGATSGTNYGFLVYAVDPCGAVSAD